MKEIDIAANIIREAASPDANIIFGTTIDESLQEQIKITVIATGFDTDIRSKLGAFERPKEKPVQAPEQPQTEQTNQNQTPEKPKKDPWNTENLDDNSQYDIPAFLRGK